MSQTSQEQLLNQLQYEVNRILEQTGRLFAAATSTPPAGKMTPVGHVQKLKKILPEAENRFHQALDALEDELEVAKLVMRRDLAVLREKSNPGPTTAPVELPNAPESSAQSLKGEGASSGDDVPMEDVQPNNAAEEVQDLTNEAPSTQNPPAAEETTTTQETSTQDPASQAKTSESNSATLEPSLHVDTSSFGTQKDGGNDITSAPPAEDDLPPDTGTFSNTNDLDSLFGGPISAGPGEAPEFNADTTLADDFDFDAFSSSLVNNGGVGESNDLSALLPGLEDYANTQPDGGEPLDFDEIFATNLATNPDDPTGNMQHRDSTFDGLGDLGDFDFTGTGEGEDGADANQEFDFSMGE